MGDLDGEYERDDLEEDLDLAEEEDTVWIG